MIIFRFIGSLNTFVAGRTKEESDKSYRENNVEQRRLWYQNNKEHARNKNKEYKLLNRDKVLEKQREYNALKKDEI